MPKRGKTKAAKCACTHTVPHTHLISQRRAALAADVCTWLPRLVVPACAAASFVLEAEVMDVCALVNSHMAAARQHEVLVRLPVQRVAGRGRNCSFVAAPPSP